jgi:hypothetical protein
MEEREGHMMQHACTCVVDLAGEGLTTIERHQFDPVTWPEIKVLQEVHGEDAVFNIRPISLVPRQSTLREKERLVLIYGREVVEAVYAGKSFNMEWFVPGWPIDPTKARRKAPDDRPKPARIQKPDDAASVDAAI